MLPWKSQFVLPSLNFRFDATVLVLPYEYSHGFVKGDHVATLPQRHDTEVNQEACFMHGLPRIVDIVNPGCQ